MWGGRWRSTRSVLEHRAVVIGRGPGGAAGRAGRGGAGRAAAAWWPGWPGRARAGWCWCSLVRGVSGRGWGRSWRGCLRGSRRGWRSARAVLDPLTGWSLLAVIGGPGGGACAGGSGGGAAGAVGGDGGAGGVVGGFGVVAGGGGGSFAGGDRGGVRGGDVVAGGRGEGGGGAEAGAGGAGRDRGDGVVGGAGGGGAGAAGGLGRAGVGGGGERAAARWCPGTRRPWPSWWRRAQGDGVRARVLPVDYASHGAQVEEIRAEILGVLDGIMARPARIPMISAMTGSSWRVPRQGAATGTTACVRRWSSAGRSGRWRTPGTGCSSRCRRTRC